MLSRAWCHRSGLHAPIFLPCSGFGRDPTPQWLLQWQAEGWRHSLHPEGYSARTSQLPPTGAALAHPHALCAAAQLPEPELLGMWLRRKCAFNALCLRQQNILLQAAQYSEVCYKQKRSEDFSQQRLQVLCVMETSRFAASSTHSHSWSALKAPKHTALPLHPTGLGTERKEGTGEDRKNNKLNY